MSFSWKCPFHVFVAGAISSMVLYSSITCTISLTQNYLSKKTISDRDKDSDTNNQRTSDRYLSSSNSLTESVFDFSAHIPRELRQSLYSEELAVATELALEAGKNMMKALAANSNKQANVKSESVGCVDFVTETDKQNESYIFETLKRRFPGYKFIGEESSADAGAIEDLTDDPTWIVDPIDGTTNFVHGFPYSCVSIALVVSKSSVVGVVYDPFKSELYQVVKGSGAYLNSQRIFVSKVTQLKDALVLTENGYGREPEHINNFCKGLAAVLGKGIHAVRLCGSAVIDLCYIAAGRLDVIYNGLGGDAWKPWDYAAGVLMVTEAGGVVSQLNGLPFHLFSSSIVAGGTDSLRQDLVNTVSSANISVQAP